MLTLADEVLIALVILGLPLRAWVAMRQLRAAGEQAQAELRPRVWTRGILTQWLLSLGVAMVWLANRRGPGSLGLVPRATWGLGGVALGIALVVLIVLGQRRQLDSDADMVRRVRARLELAGPLLPRTRREWPHFSLLALTAGVCEELLFRGFLVWVLGHALGSPWAVMGAQAVLFGLAHAYQGPRGMLLTGALGAFLGAVVWVTGSLWAAMVIHALMDLNAGDLAIRVLGAGEPAVAGRPAAGT